MSFIEVLLLAIGLSMDAFAVAICKGLSVNKLSPKHYLIIGLYFGGFQALMPFLGFLLGYNFRHVISGFDYIIAFVLLSIIGFNMIKEAFEDNSNDTDDNFKLKAMLPLAIATSIDALAVGITFAAMGFSFFGKYTENVFFDIATIGITTFAISVIGIKIGNIFGSKYKKNAEIFGGIILILIGIKIFAEHFI